MVTTGPFQGPQTSHPLCGWCIDYISIFTVAAVRQLQQGEISLAQENLESRLAGQPVKDAIEKICHGGLL